jgi:hypothetical protein
MKKIQQYIRTTYTALISKVSGKFKKKENKKYNDFRDIDWYYQKSWIDINWFKHKIKRFLMQNFIYTLFENFLETYFIEIEFYSPETNLTNRFNKNKGTDYQGDFRYYLPILAQVKHQSQASYIMNRIVETLRKEYRIKNFRLLKVDETPLSKESIELLKERLNLEYKGYETSKLEVLTFEPNNIGEYNYNKPELTEIDLKVIKLTDISWLTKKDYIVIIKKELP